MHSKLLLVVVLLALIALPVAVLAQSQGSDLKVVAQPALPSDVASVNVTGTWHLQLYSGNTPDSLLEVQLEQGGSEVKGKMNCGNCLKIINNAPLAGKIDGANVRLDRKDVRYAGFNLTIVSDKEMTGTYTGQSNKTYTVRGSRQ